MSKTVKERVMNDISAALDVIAGDMECCNDREIEMNFEIYALMLYSLFKHIHPVTIQKMPTMLEIQDIFNNSEIDPVNDLYDYFQKCLGGTDG